MLDKLLLEISVENKLLAINYFSSFTVEMWHIYGQYKIFLEASNSLILTFKLIPWLLNFLIFETMEFLVTLLRQLQALSLATQIFL